jgi:hypothetical protein
MEIIAPLSLIDALGLRDGDEFMLQVHAPMTSEQKAKTAKALQTFAMKIKRPILLPARIGNLDDILALRIEWT